MNCPWCGAVVSATEFKVTRVKKDQATTQDKVRRMGKSYVEGVFDDNEFHRQKRLLEMELKSLVVPQANAAEEAGKLIQDLPRLWAGATIPAIRVSTLCTRL